MSPAPNPAVNVLVNGQWTGPGTANPQAGVIAGADPGLTLLSQHMGMTEAQTAAWIATQAAARRSPIVETSPTGKTGVPSWVWAVGAVTLVLFASGSSGKR